MRAPMVIVAVVIPDRGKDPGTFFVQTGPGRIGIVECLVL